MSLRCLPVAMAIVLSVGAASAQDWRGELNIVDNDLRTQHYAHARKSSIKLINSMCDHLGTGPGSIYTLALTVAYRAMSEAGLKKSEDADWYWHVALALYPKLAQNDWKPYGEVGEWAASRKPSDEVHSSDSPMLAPIAIKKLEPKCPLSAISGGYFQPVTVAAIIGDDGIARSPRLVSSTVAPTLVYAAFEALKQWQFQPGTAEGKPMPMRYEVTVDFKPPHP